MSPNHWLMKAEPDSRIEKGKDVKFSVDDFESVGTTPWEGVRNHEAKKLMQSMKIGDKVLFYHSNCKTPGVAGFAEVVKEAYPDYTAWDPEHPYYDAVRWPKSDKDDPKWFMVDVGFKSRCAHFVPLALFKRVANIPSNSPPDDIAYIGEDGVRAIKGMALVNRGRLSVQPVSDEAWDTVQLLAEKGGWVEEDGTKKKAAARKPGKQTGEDTKEVTRKTRSAKAGKGRSKVHGDDEPLLKEEHDGNEPLSEEADEKSATRKRPRAKKRKADASDVAVGTRRSTRAKR